MEKSMKHAMGTGARSQFVGMPVPGSAYLRLFMCPALHMPAMQEVHMKNVNLQSLNHEDAKP